MTWVSLGVKENGVEIFGRLDEDGLIRVTCVAEHPEFAEWVAEGNTPDEWPPVDPQGGNP